VSESFNASGIPVTYWRGSVVCGEADH